MTAGELREVTRHFIGKFYHFFDNNQNELWSPSHGYQQISTVGSLSLRVTNFATSWVASQIVGQGYHTQI